jgi:adenylate kinase
MGALENQKKIFIFIGPPGSGKGSLSRLCEQRLGWVQLSTGDLCRQHIAQGTEIGKQMDFAIKSGKLISDSLIVDMVGNWLLKQQNDNKDVIFDGFPRTVPQVHALQNLLKERDIGAKLLVVHMIIPDEVVETRLKSRLVCGNKDCQIVYSASNKGLAPRKEMECDTCSSVLIRRSDDHDDSIKERLVVYYRHKEGLLEFYKAAGHAVIDLPMHGHVEEIFDTFKNMVGLKHA